MTTKAQRERVRMIAGQEYDPDDVPAYWRLKEIRNQEDPDDQADVKNEK